MPFLSLLRPPHHQHLGQEMTIAVLVHSGHLLLGLCPSPQGTLNPHPHLASFQLPTHTCPQPPPASLGCAAFPGPYPTCMPSALSSPQVFVAALHSHACAQASRVCPAHCQPSSESGRASLPLAHFVAAVDGWVCFLPVCFGFRRKKNIPK